MLADNEILVTAYPVKYHDIEYHNDYIVVTQNRTRRRVYNGWYFEDTGAHIYVSDYVAGCFQHKRRERKFILNTLTKEYKDYKTVVVEKHKPQAVTPIKSNEISELRTSS